MKLPALPSGITIRLYDAHSGVRGLPPSTPASLPRAPHHMSTSPSMLGRTGSAVSVAKRVPDSMRPHMLQAGRRAASAARLQAVGRLAAPGTPPSGLPHRDGIQDRSWARRGATGRGAGRRKRRELYDAGDARTTADRAPCAHDLRSPAGLHRDHATRQASPIGGDKPARVSPNCISRPSTSCMFRPRTAGRRRRSEGRRGRHAVRRDGARSPGRGAKSATTSQRRRTDRWPDEVSTPGSRCRQRRRVLPEGAAETCRARRRSSG